MDKQHIDLIRTIAHTRLHANVYPADYSHLVSLAAEIVVERRTRAPDGSRRLVSINRESPFIREAAMTVVQQYRDAYERVMNQTFGEGSAHDVDRAIFEAPDGVLAWWYAVHFGPAIESP
jgi:hypothetical protein